MGPAISETSSTNGVKKANTSVQVEGLALCPALRDNNFDDYWLSGALAPEKLPDQVVRADVHFPGVAWTIAAALF